MKNKKTAYIMVPIVLAIWGMIAWKVYAAMKGKGDQVSVHANLESEKLNATEIPDTIQLIANYRDPFLDKQIVVKDNSKSRIKNSKLPVVKVPEPPKAPTGWPKISYQGLIKRNSDQKTVGFLSVNGASYFVQGGEGAGEVNVGKLWKDSVEIFFGKDKKIFKK